MARQRRRHLQLEAVGAFVERELAPAIREDGGDIRLDGVKGQVVSISLGAACATCPARGRTISEVVQKRLRERFGPQVTVRGRFVKWYFQA
jgi:Fe-S cluster biogenesis protein NfuA